MELEVDDPDGTFNVRGYRIVYVQEDDAIGDDQHGIVGVRYTGERYISRLGNDSPAKRTEAGWTWRIQLHDLNTRLSWRLNVGNDCKRPAETDLERIAWLMSTAEMNWLDDDDTYIDTTGAVAIWMRWTTPGRPARCVDDCGSSRAGTTASCGNTRATMMTPSRRNSGTSSARHRLLVRQEVNNYRPDVEADSDC